MNDARIDELLKELYAVDGGLRTHEAALRAMLTELIASRPTPVIDGRFAAELRGKLLSRAADLKAAPKTDLIHLIAMKRLFTYAVPGLAVLAIAALGVMTLGPAPRSGGRLALESGSVAPSGLGSMSRLADGAFGEIGFSSGAPYEAGEADGILSETGAGYAGVTGLGAAPSTSVAMPREAGGDSAKMIAPYPPGDLYVPTVYRYVYKGDAIDDLLQPKVDVIKPQAAASTISADSLTRFGLGLADLSRLRDAKLQNFSITEDREYGYNVWIDLQNGTLGFSQNARWPGAYPEWDPATGMPKDPVRMDELPSDKEAIRIADAFLDGYGIDRARYGTPRLRDEWRRGFETTGLPYVYVPEAVSVVYPTLVDGKELLEMNGAPTGMEVSVHARLRRVTGAWNITAWTYTASAYEGETDAARILEVASKGGPYAWSAEGDVKTVEITIGTPKVGLVRTWQSDGELYVPALLFPLQDAPAELVWQPYLAVPLAKDLLKSPVIDGPRPMPLEIMK